MMYKCWGCYDEFNRRKDEYFCTTCQPLYDAGEIIIEVHTSHPDRAYEGWNEGLGTKVVSKKHYDTLLAERGLVNIPEAGQMQEIQTKAVETKKQKNRKALEKAYSDAVKARR